MLCHISTNSCNDSNAIPNQLQVLEDTLANLPPYQHITPEPDDNEHQQDTQTGISPTILFSSAESLI